MKNAGAPQVQIFGVKNSAATRAAERFFKESNMRLFSVARTLPEIFAQIESTEPVVVETKWFQTK